MTCDPQVNCSSGDECGNRRWGSFDASLQTKTLGEADDCAPRSDWHIKHTVNPLSSGAEEYNEVISSKIIWLNSFFDIQYGGTGGPPDHRLTTSCENYLEGEGVDSFSYPLTVSYRAEHPSHQTTSDYRLERPFPNGSGDEDGINGRVIDLVVGVLSAGHPLAGAAGAVIKYYIDSIDSNSVSTDYGGSRDTIQWDLDYDLNSDYPQGPCDTTGVQFEIDTSRDYGQPYDVDTAVQYTYAYYTYNFPKDGCVCSPDPSLGYTILEHTTPWCSNQVTFEVGN